MKQVKIVLDTSVFVNPDSNRYFGENPRKALINFLDSIEDKKHISCYIPPSVYEELLNFTEKLLPTKKTLLINKKPPSSYESGVPARLVYEFIEEIRLRINKGLRIAEKYSRQNNGEESIKTLRQEYRVAMREGVIDSKEDFDLILLAKELGAYLATADFGLVTWAQKLGITCISAEELKELIA
ncbi:MAG: RNA ligase partner protein [Candidatus Omnitrophica bacterium]|nr:RNA ligase partner protein [Candidatus Omnitrophota bacterium]MBU2473679.1 RNA ligase partner protein [Candidatus Omnitrophota bacterium]